MTDPETAIALAAKSALDPALLNGVQVPGTAGGRPSRRIAAAAAAVAVGIMVPVVAHNTGDHDHATDTGVSRPLSGGSATTPPAARAAASPEMTAELGALLAKIDQRLKGDTDPADRKKLSTLRDAVAAKLAQLSR